MNSTTNIQLSDTNTPVRFKANPLTDSIVSLTFGPESIQNLSIVLDRRTLSNLRRALAEFTQAERDPDSLRRRPRKAAQ